MTIKSKGYLFIGIWFVLGLVPVLCTRFGFSTIYANPFYRLLEFVMGILICDFFLNGKKKVNFAGLKICMVMGIFIIYITWHANSGSVTIWRYFYTYVLVGIFAMLLYLFAHYNPKGIFIKILDNKFVRYFSSLSYTFFFMQLFVFRYLDLLQKNTTWFNSYINIKSILISFSMCFVGAVLLHEFVEKPFKRIGNRIYQRKKNNNVGNRI